MRTRHHTKLASILWILTALLLSTTAFAQYQGIWKDTGDPPIHNFYIQHYSTGSTIVIHTTDAVTFHAFLADMSGNKFESDSLDEDKSMHLLITFVSGTLGTAKLTDNVGGGSTDMNLEKKFGAIRTMHSGVWKDPDSVFNMYVQDYETGSTVIVYTFDAVNFQAFIGHVDILLFTAQNMADASLELDMAFSAYDEGMATVEPVAAATYLPEASTFTYDMTKIYEPATLDIDAQFVPKSGSAPLEVQFTAVSTVPFVSWNWDFDDGQTSTQQNPMHTYTSPGSYDVVLTMTNPSFSITCLGAEPIQVQQPGSPVISGTITLTPSAAGLAGVTVTADNGGGSGTTDAQGAYSITVPSGWSGTVTPALTGYTFSPTSQTFSDVTSNQTQDFTATAGTPTVNVSGTVTKSGDGGLSGVLVFFEGLGGVTTDASGNYDMDVPYGWGGPITPSKGSYTFSPPQVWLNNATFDYTEVNFAATPPQPTVTISGTITVFGDGGLLNAVVDFQDLDLAFTDASGNYSMDVPYEWAGTITPSKDNYTFEPEQVYISGATSDMNQDFVAELIDAYVHLSGTITSGGVGLGDVAITLSGYGTTHSDSQGAWSTDVPYGWAGTITPSKDNYTFVPEQITVNGATFDDDGVDFTGTPTRVTIYGTVVAQPADGGQPMSGVAITYTGDSESGSVITGISGQYSFTVPYGWTGSASASKTGWTFAPPLVEYMDQLADSVTDYTGYADGP